jgi:SRSO17 transposase
MLGLLAELPRKNCWTIAEHAGDSSPHGMQHLLARARWDADGVRDDVRALVVEHLSHPDAVLVVDLCRSPNYAEAGVRRDVNALGRVGFWGWPW